MAQGLAQHQTRRAALEEGVAGRRIEQAGEAEHVSIEGAGAVEIAHGDRDLGEMRGRTGIGPLLRLVLFVARGNY
jgi:hypothetical protein